MELPAGARQALPPRRDRARRSGGEGGLVAVGEYVPSRGDLVWLQFNPRSGHEQAGRRPAVVVSPTSYNRTVGLALVCPVTSRSRGYPFEVRLPDHGPVGGVILADQLKSLDWRARKAERIGSLSEEALVQVVARILRLVDPSLG